MDDRLAAAYDMVPPCGICADIGADHGKLSAALLGEGKAGHMLVSDISEKALAKARKLLGYLRLADRATFAVADGLQGLSALKGQAVEAVCILGMGGDTIGGVLLEGKERLCGATLILGAQTELPAVRNALCAIGYRLREERIAEASGRYYLLMKATPALAGEAAYTKQELLLGPCLLQTLPAQWRPVLERREQLLETAEAALEQSSSERSEARLAEVKRELAYVRGALAVLAQEKT